jgi:hypothetical protein
MNAIMKLTLLGALAASLALTPDSSWARGFRGGGFRASGFRGGGYRGGGYRGGGYYGSPYGYGARGWSTPSFFLGYGIGRATGRGYYGGYGYPYGYGGYGYGYGSPYYSSYGYGNAYGSPIVSSGAATYNGAVVNSVPTQSYSGGPIALTYPAQQGPTLHYELNGVEHMIQPGNTAQFVDDRSWTIEFDRGPGRGSARYSLHEGVYKFKSTDHGWELVQAANSVANTANSGLTPNPPADATRPTLATPELPPSPKL